MTAKLTGKVALITGASAGIGQACARVLAQEGARLVLTARRQERLDQLKQEAEKLGTKAISVIGDARDESTAIKTVEAATRSFGQIDILINNTGVGNYNDGRTACVTNAASFPFWSQDEAWLRIASLFNFHLRPHLQAAAIGPA